MNENFVDFMANYRNVPIAVGVSGGVDSVCLLHWLVEIGANVVVLHVNHGLRPAADADAEYVSQLCATLRVPCHVLHWSGEKPSAGIESAARDARYQLMTEFCHKNDISHIAIAHQADDQIETFLMNLGRGSGLFGLAAMRGVVQRDGLWLLRPLLNVPRRELVKYCDDRGIKYLHDEMNDDARFTRVRIRQNRHVLRDMLGIDDERILLAVRNLGRVRDEMCDNIDNMTRDVIADNRAIFSDSFLFDLGPDIRLKFIGTLVMKIGGGKYAPRLKSLEFALNKLRGNCKITLGRCVIRRHGTRILIAREGTRTSFRTKHENRHKKSEK